MRWHGRRSDHNRRRRLHAFSRYPETSGVHVIELSPDATDYLALGGTDDASFFDHWRVLQMVLQDAESKLTRKEIFEQWPADFPRPDLGTLSRWLGRAVPLGHVRREGTGRRSDLFRYWLPERSDDFPPTGASEAEVQEWNQRQMPNWLAGLGKLARTGPPNPKGG